MGQFVKTRKFPPEKLQLKELKLARHSEHQR